jgi:hypothetical protein
MRGTGREMSSTHCFQEEQRTIEYGTEPSMRGGRDCQPRDECIHPSSSILQACQPRAFSPAHLKTCSTQQPSLQPSPRTRCSTLCHRLHGSLHGSRAHGRCPWQHAQQSREGAVRGFELVGPNILAPAGKWQGKISIESHRPRCGRSDAHPVDGGEAHHGLVLEAHFCEACSGHRNQPSFKP